MLGRSRQSEWTGGLAAGYTQLEEPFPRWRRSKKPSTEEHPVPSHGTVSESLSAGWTQSHSVVGELNQDFFFSLFSSLDTLNPKFDLNWESQKSVRLCPALLYITYPQKMIPHSVCNEYYLQFSRLFHPKGPKVFYFHRNVHRKKPISPFLAYYQIAKYDHRSHPGQFAQDLSSMQECVCTVHLCILIPFLVHKQLPMKLLVAFRGFHWINQLFGLDEIIISCHVIRLRSVTGQRGDLAMRVTKWIPVRVSRLMRLFPLNIGICWGWGQRENNVRGRVLLKGNNFFPSWLLFTGCKRIT